MYDDIMMLCPSCVPALPVCHPMVVFHSPLREIGDADWLYYVHRSALAFCLTTPPAQWNTFFTLHTPANNGVLRVYDDREKYGA
jgi:hypothetical protein